MKFAIILLSFPFSTLAALNGRCTGSKATGQWKEEGICIKTSTCRRYKGRTTNGACPNDPDDVKCCLIDECNGQPDQLGWSSWCEWTSDKNSICNTIGSYLNNRCPGGDNYKCCETP
ncbi:hypothetical protein B0T14DRAFT_569740 [Immersiella caudata]|uniref:Uncharacterized protein n=1 Tax=Immersiella caudata TaxID=314043 RepID=A0AA39WE55_9PEZI|nr:hypothetical protein B0T14DRAFT_569740 [Immersiella caudata]